ncbi:toxin-antitoxin system HicB family antitoxin [Enterobacterales bacterium CwR94]|nr:toxin-antitoxin system HicB family antitoxin [Enterobacterales bacterium CwR94]
MNNVMKIEGHRAVISYDPEIEMFRGEFIGLNGGADFYAGSVVALRAEGAASLAIYLDECKKDGVAPYRTWSGKVTTRLTPERHHSLAIAAQAIGVSINDLLNEGVDLVIARHAAR